MSHCIGCSGVARVDQLGGHQVSESNDIVLAVTYNRIGSTPTFLYFDLYLYSAYAAYYVYFKVTIYFQGDPGIFTDHAAYSPRFFTNIYNIYYIRL